MTSAVAAVAKRDKETPLRDYQAALALNPTDQRAAAGIGDAERLLDKVCYEILGRWECANPRSRSFRITLTAVSFSNTWVAKLSADGRCLDAAHGGGFERR